MASNRRRAVLAVAVIALAACGACGGDDGAPAGKYRATGTLLHDGLADDDRAGWATELEILKSRALLDEVLRDVDPAARAKVEATARRLEVKRRGGSRVIEVSMYGDDGPFVREICNRLLRAYLDYQVRAAQGPYEDERKRLEARLDELEAELRKGPTEPPDVVKEFETTVNRLRVISASDHGHLMNVQIVDPCFVAKRGERS